MQILSRIFDRRRRYDDLSVSIQEHIELRAEELMEEGMPRAEAERTARREFGNVTQIKERSREEWQWAWLESILADLKLVLRRLKKSPGFAATILLTLAIGIGANTTVFSVVNCVLLKPLPYPNSGELVDLSLNAPGAGGLASFASGLQLSPSMFLTFSENNKTFQSMGIWTSSRSNVTGVGQPHQVNAELVSDGVLQTLNVPATAGRWFTAADQDPRGAKTAILGYGYWQRRFGGDRGVIGRSIQVDAQTREIVGVMPRGFRMVDNDFDVMMPMAIDRSQLRLAPFGYSGMGRLKPGITPAQASADVARLLPLWMDSWSNGPGTNPHYYERWLISPNFQLLKKQVIGSVSNVLWVVMGTVGLVMLIACTNVANLLLVRAESRQQELLIRSALGAGRARIARELLVESVTLGLMGGVLAVGVAYAGLRLLTAIGPADLPRLSEISLDGGSLLFALLLSVFSGLFFGSIPVFRYARARAATALMGNSRTASASRSRNRSRNVLVVAQVAMALVLLVSALLMIRTFAALRTVDPGFSDAAHVQTVGIWIPDLLEPDAEQVTRTQNEIAGRIAAIPGVTSVGFAGGVPMEGFDPNWDELRVEGKNYEGGEPPLMLFNYVSPGFFGAMGTRIVAGRDFTWDDNYNLRNNVVVSENFARDSWGSPAAAVGKRVRQFTNMPWQQVIGVVEDVRQHGLDQPAPAILYWPAMLMSPYTRPPTIDGPRAVRFAIRSNRAGTEGFLHELQQAVWSVNPNLPLASVQTMRDFLSKSLERTSFTLVMLAIAGSMALVLGVIGIYGVISYSVSQRTREIGIRLALGAQKSELKWMFVRSALALTGAGVVIGVCAAAGLMQLMKSLLFSVSPLDPVTFVTVPLVLAVAAMVASYLPARRASAVDPVEALRVE
jgi:predicted permease